MKLSKRSKMSLCQFLRQFRRSDLALLLEKYGLSTHEFDDQPDFPSRAYALRDTINQASDSQVEELVQELARKSDSICASANRHDVFGKRWNKQQWNELCRDLKLDGYARELDKCGGKLDRFVPIEPIIDGAALVEDDLTKEIRRSNLANTDGVLQVMKKSSDAFRDGDFNGCLSNARVALQTLALSIAQAYRSNHVGDFDPERWGSVIDYLRASGFISTKQEAGVTGVFTFISPGSHTPIPRGEEEFARLGRNLSLSICYFLVKKFNAIKNDS